VSIYGKKRYDRTGWDEECSRPGAEAGLPGSEVQDRVGGQLLVLKSL